MTRPRFSLAAALVAVLVVAATPAILPRSAGPAPVLAAGEEGADRSALTVSGEGTVKVEPDTAHLDLAVETQAPTAREAQERNAQRMTAVLERLRGLGIGKDDMRTTGINLYPDYRYEEKGGPRLVGYRATNSLRVTVHDLNRVGELIDAAVAAGANQLQGVSFTVEESDGAQREALAKAVRDARAKAEAIAGAAGMFITGVRTIIEGGAPVPPVIMREMYQMEAAAPAASAPTPVIPGDLTIRATVSVSYSIR